MESGSVRKCQEAHRCAIVCEAVASHLSLVLLFHVVFREPSV